MLRDPRISHRINDAVRIAVKESNSNAALLIYALPQAFVRPICFDSMDVLLEACKTGRLFDVIENFLDIPMPFLEFAVRSSLSHGHFYAFKFAFREMLEEFGLQKEDMNEETVKRTKCNVAETIDYCIDWMLPNDHSFSLLQYIGQTIQPHAFLQDVQLYPAVSALKYIFDVHCVLLDVFKNMNLQDIAGIILQYHLKEFRLIHKK